MAHKKSDSASDSKKSMFILGVHMGHTAGAALLKDGEIVAMISEERFNRIKNWYGFPAESIKYLLNAHNLTTDDIETVALSGKQFVLSQGSLSSSASVLDLISVASKVYGNLEYALGRNYMPLNKLKKIVFEGPASDKIARVARELISKKLNISEGKILFVDHHLCHAFSAYYGLSKSHEKALVLTLDGEGDGVAATVNVFDGFSFEQIASTPKEASLGYVYSLTTSFLGMKALEHEYKVMGLAPYASSKGEKYYLKTYDNVFKDVIWLSKKNPLVFESSIPTNRFDRYLRAHAVGERFDNVAGAVQHLTELLVCKWVENAIAKTGISNVYCAGGVFMNVKMNMAISKLPSVKQLHVLPSCGDESTPMGSAYFAYIEYCHANHIAPRPQPITHLYLGPNFDDEVEKYIKTKNLAKKYTIQKATPQLIAKMLAKGEILARCVGPMEFGARSLGNRAIIANPSDLRYVWQINDQIKMRDFWMPFAPSMKEGSELRYIKNPKKFAAPYMILAFDSTELAHNEVRAAMHQADFTLRPQIVSRDWNEKYHDIIAEFEKLTGIGAVLNTSFNLHGKPIVMTPYDAVDEVFEHSGLNHLILGDYLLTKKE